MARFGRPPGPRRRLAVLAAACGLAGSDGLVGVVISRRLRIVAHVRSPAE
ncbi:hypothetical protein [Pseudonocardia kunmingensis]|nr:hypothetical protein [Pseudonocardia kunmingensis]